MTLHGGRNAVLYFQGIIKVVFCDSTDCEKTWPENFIMFVKGEDLILEKLKILFLHF